MKPLVLKNALFKLSDLYMLAGLSVAVWFSFKNFEIGSLILLTIMLIWLGIYLVRAMNRTDQLTIDQKGITMKGQKTIKWSRIQYAYVEIKTQFSTRSSQDYPCLIVVIDHFKEEFDLSELSFSKKKIKEAVEYFSGRDIGDQEDEFQDNILEILSDYPRPSSIISSFDKLKKYLKKMIIIGLIAWLLLGIALAYLFSFLPSIAIAYACAFLSLKFLYDSGLSRFRKQPEIAQLDMYSYNRALYLYELRQTKKGQQETLGMIVVFGLFVLLGTLLIHLN